jgi:hypothetical protein
MSRYRHGIDRVVSRAARDAVFPKLLILHALIP